MLDFSKVFFPAAIDKVFVFFGSDGNVVFFLPWLNFDFIFICLLVIVTLNFIFDVVFIFLSRWRRFRSFESNFK